MDQVSITATTRKWPILPLLYSSATYTTNRTSTDKFGRFEFRNLVGDTFRIHKIAKDGYELAQNVRLSYGYLNSRPDNPKPTNAVVFTMWRLQGAEPMIYNNRWGEIRMDGVPTWLDLVRGRTSTNQSAQGELRISVLRNPTQLTSDHYGKWDWTLKVEAPSGGVLRTDDPFMYLAPETGYSESFELVRHRDSPDWADSAIVSFFAKTRDTNYSRIIIRFATHTEDAFGSRLSFETYLNPAGSRNLEFDAAKLAPRPND